MEILTTDQLINYCKSYNWTRKVTQLHVHHTWKPCHKDYNGNNGLQLQQNMKAYHLSLGWSDIGQHLTLLPDGRWVTGRDFNLKPASITDWNTGAFAIEMVGNFDTGNDKFDGLQAQEMFKFCAFFVVFKLLNIDKDVKFHRDNPTAGKTCPGTGIDRTWFMNKLKNTVKGDEEMTYYKTVNDVPAWGKAAIQKLIDKGSLKGDPQGNLNVSEDFVRIFTVLDREGLIK